MSGAVQVGGRYTGPVTLHGAAVATANSTAQDVAIPGGGVYNHVLLQVTGTFVASLALQGTLDGTNYVALEVQAVGASGTRLTAMTATGAYRANIAGFKKIRTALTWTSGTSITVTANLMFGGEIIPPATLGASTATVGATLDGGPAWTSVFGVSAARYTSADRSGSAASVTDAPTGGQKLVITDIVVAVDTAMRVDFKEETSGTVLYSLYMAANGVAQITPRSKLKLATADKKLQLQTSAAGNIAVTAFYYSEA